MPDVDLRRELPAIARHEGVWEGELVELDTDVAVQDRFETGYVEGTAWEAAHDDRSVVLTWTRADEPDVSFHELITLGSDSDQRARTWHRFEGGGLTSRTLIEERRIE